AAKISQLPRAEPMAHSGGRHFGPGHGTRQRNGKRRPLAEFSFDTYRSVVQFDDFLGESQTQPGAGETPGCSGFQLFKLAKYTGQIVTLDPDATVFDRDFY